MGDGPGYDYLAQQVEDNYRRKRLTQKRRVDMLHQVMMGPGFGDHDWENTRLEKEAAECLHRAYDLLQLFTQPYRPVTGGKGPV